MLQALLAQASNELRASSWYLAAAYWAEARGYMWLATKFRNNSSEEHSHSEYFANLVSGYFGEEVSYEEIEPPVVDAADYCAVIEQAQQLEELVTSQLNTICQLAVAEGDYAIVGYLSWMLSGQVYSVAGWRDLYMQAKSCEDYGLFDSTKMGASCAGPVTAN